MGKIRVEVGSAKEYRKAIKHAEALGLSVKEEYWMGGWESDDREPIFLSGNTNPVEKAGYEYFHVEVSGPDGNVMVKVKPYRSSTRDKGSIAITFTD